MKKVLLLSFITIHCAFSFEVMPTWNNSLSGSADFNPFIIGTGLNYTRDSSGLDSLSPSISWMMKYQINKRFSVKSNIEAGFIKDKNERNSFISSQADLYLGIKTSRDFEISLKSGIHSYENSQNSISYGFEIEHNSGFLRKLSVNYVYLGYERIPNLESPIDKIISGFRFKL